MNNKKLVSIIVSKILVGELTFASLEREVIDAKHQEILKMASKDFNKIYNNLNKWWDDDTLPFEDVIRVVEIFELIHLKEYTDVSTFISKLSEKTGKSKNYLEGKILSNQREDLYFALKRILTKYCYKVLGVMPNSHWELLSPSERLELLEEIEKFMYDFETD